jgi:drug/metabolite transporter (DMT)-like permease
MSTRDWFLLGLLSLVWGSGFLFTRIAVRDIPPATLVEIRAAFSAIILLVLIRARGVPLPAWTWSVWRPFFVMGLLNMALPFTLNGWGLTRIDSSLAGILTATVPIFTVAFAHFATDDERFSAAKALGIALGMAGVVAIVGRNPGALTSGSGLATLAVLLSSMLYGASGVYGRSLRATPPLVLAWAQMCASTLLLLPLVVLVERPWRGAGWGSDAVLSAIVLTLGTVAAYLLYFQILMQAGAVNASLVAYVIPVIAVLLGTVFLDERLQLQHIVGMVLIIGGMATLDGRLARRLSTMRVAKPGQT